MDDIQHITFKGKRNVCNVWFNNDKRKSNLNYVKNVGNDNDWLGFVRNLLRSPVATGYGSFCFSDPSTQHSSYFVDVFRQSDVSFVFKFLKFPCNL